jgi:hypothetical protein
MMLGTYNLKFYKKKNIWTIQQELSILQGNGKLVVGFFNKDDLNLNNKGYKVLL